MEGHAAISLELDEQPVGSHTTWWSAGGGAALTIATSLKAGGEAFELISTYISHPSLTTLVSHLTVLAALDGQRHTYERPFDQLNGLSRRRDCCYEHLQVLAEELRGLDHHVKVLVDDGSFAQLEGVVDA